MFSHWDLLYCNACETYTQVIKGESFHISTKPLIPDICHGFFTSCPPPELPENWDEFLTEPSDDELKRMDLNARELELQFVQ